MREAFAASMSVVWKVMIGISGLGLLTIPLLREVAMNQGTDEKFGLKEKNNAEEAGGESGLTLEAETQHVAVDKELD